MATDEQFSSIDWDERNGFVMIEKSCHSCNYGIYENEDEYIRARTLTCEKRIEAKHDGKIADPKRYVCNLWEQGDIYRWI
jgi:hypothetical protein